jgi:hypothetical protein
MFLADVFLSKTAGLQLGQKPARVADKDMEQDLIKCLKVLLHLNAVRTEACPGGGQGHGTGPHQVSQGGLTVHFK